MLLAAWRNLIARKVRLALSGFAIVLGVAFVAGSFIFTDAMGHAFDQIIEGSTSDVEVAYRGANDFDSSQDTRALPASVVRRLARVPGVAAAHGNVEQQSVFVIGRNGKVVGGNGPPGLALNDTGARSVLDEPIISRATGRLPSRAGEVALDVDTARKSGYRVGDSLRLATPGRPPTLRVRLVGTVEFGSGGLNGASLTILDRTALQQAFFAGRDVYTSVSLDLEDGATQATVRDAAQKVLPAGVVARTGDDVVAKNKQSLDKILGFLNKFLLVFAAVCLVVGTFLIANTFSILVAQRSRELALLRALGASRRQVNLSVLAEAVVVGVFGSIVGLGAGYLLARGLQLLFGTFGLDLSRATFAVHPRTVLASFAVGVLVTMAATFVPARRASTLPPVAALRDDIALPESSMRRRVVVGLVLLGAGVVAIPLGFGRGGDLGLSVVGAGMLAVLLGVSLLSPWLGRPVVRATTRLYRRAFGAVGVLAGQNAERNPRRTAATASALMIGLTLVVLMSVLGRSASASTAAAVENALTSQLVVSNVNPQAAFSPDVAQQVRRLPGVGTAAELRFGSASLDGRRIQVAAVDPAQLGLALTIPMRQGSLLALRSGSIVVSDSTAKRHGYRVGSTLPVRFQAGTQRLRVAAVSQASAALPTSYLVTLDTLRRGGLVPQDTAVYVSADRSSDVPAIRKGIERIVRDLPTVTVQDPAEFVKAQQEQIDLLLDFLYILLALAVVIAVLGIVNTLALSVVERTREIGLLRAVGLSRRQLRRMVRLESLVVALLGAVLGIVMGLAFGIALQRSLADDGLDVLSIPWLRLAVFAVLALAAGVLAAVVPARRAARLDVLRAISTQ